MGLTALGGYWMDVCFGELVNSVRVFSRPEVHEAVSHARWGFDLENASFSEIVLQVAMENNED